MHQAPASCWCHQACLILARTPESRPGCHSRCRSVFSWNKYSTWGGGQGEGPEGCEGRGGWGGVTSGRPWQHSAAAGSAAGGAQFGFFFRFCLHVPSCMQSVQGCPAHPAVGVALQALEEVGAELGAQRELSARSGHQQRLPRRAVAAREAGAQQADGTPGEGCGLPVWLAAAAAICCRLSALRDGTGACRAACQLPQP